MGNSDTIIEKAGELFEENKCHCCEAIMTAVSEYLGVQNDLLLKVCTPFGGGMVSNGAACGSLIAAYLCMGVFKNNNLDAESKKNVCEAADRIFQKFLATYGSPNCRDIREYGNCRDITGYDKKDPQAVQLNAKRVKTEICIPLTKEVTRWILEELEHE